MGEGTKGAVYEDIVDMMNITDKHLRVKLQPAC